MRLAKKGKEPAVTTKFAIGLFLLAIGFGVFVWAAHTATHGGQASMLFIVLAYFLFPIAELSIIPISLSLVTKMSPVGLGSLMVGIWMLSNAASSYFTGVISKYGKINFQLHSVAQLQHAAVIYQHLFAGTAIILAASGVVALLLGPWVKRLMRGSEGKLSSAEEAQ
jgi:POT family proton-dependent oligopeptide transporter